MCQLDLTAKFLSGQSPAVSPGTWSATTGCPDCPNPGAPITNPSIVTITNGKDVDLGEKNPGCYTFRYSTGPNVCDGCDDCAEYKVNLIPGIVANGPAVIDIGCVDPNTCDQEFLYLAAFLNCGEEARLLDGGACTSPNTEIFKFDNPSQGIRWRPHDGNGIIPFAGSHNSFTADFPGVTFCNGGSTAQYEARIIIPSGTGNYFEPGGAPYGIFKLCEYIQNTGNTSVEFTWSVRAASSQARQDCADDCIATYTLRIDWEIAESIPAGSQQTVCIEGNAGSITLSNVWTGLPSVVTFARGECDGSNQAGPAPDQNTGLINYDCTDVGNTYTYSASKGSGDCERCNTIQVQVVEAPALDDISFSFCRTSAANNAVTVTQFNPAQPVLQDIGGGGRRLTLAQIQDLIEGECSGNPYQDPTTGYNDEDFALGSGDCSNEININRTIDVTRNPDIGCGDSATVSVYASPVYGTPDDDPANNDLCVINCADIDIRSLITYSAAQVAADRDCLLNAGAPPSTEVLMTIWWRRQGETGSGQVTAAYGTDYNLSANWAELDSIDLCNELNNEGCIEIFIEFTFNWQDPNGNGSECHFVTIFPDWLRLCPEPTPPAATSTEGCNEVAD